ncbi:MAG: T9SS type A sorting domain-containing protein [Algibacter sp.]
MKNITSQKFLIALFFLISEAIIAQQTVVFNPYNLKKGVIENGAAGFNACWLMDSDLERPKNTLNEERFNEMEIGSLRFPYGHLADNYLWDIPPYGSSPLVPKVASNTTIPGYFSNTDVTKWSWATNEDGTFRKDLDFDEYMAICQRQNIKPLVVVNAQSHKYKNGVSYETLKTSAVEWVKYAKLKGYEVAYWQIGNEIDHHPDVISKNEYYTLYADFVTAMKQADPSIACGPGILSSTAMLKDLLDSNSDLVDFTSCHQYLFADPYKSYDEFVNYNGADVNKNVRNTQNTINNSNKPDLPILITESNANGNWNSDVSNINDLYKGLAWFDMLFTQQENENVVYQYMWNTHSPWQGEFGLGGPPNGLTNDMSNNITATGWPIKILNTTSEERIMIPDSKVHGNTYSYGSYSPNTGNMTLYLMNKSLESEDMTVNIGAFDLNSNYKRYVFSGDSPYDTNPTFSESGTITITENGFTTNLPAHSLVVVKLSGTVSHAVYNIEHVGNNLHLKSNDLETDVIAVNNSDSELNTKWELVDAIDGYVYIQNVANGMRLQGVSEVTGDGDSVQIVGEPSSDDSVQWKFTETGNNWFIDNKAHNRRLNINGENKVSFGQTSWIGEWVQWKLIAVENTLSLKTLKEFNVHIYPNPVKKGSLINLDYVSTNNESNLRIDITSLSGALAISEKIILLDGVSNYKINIRALSSGIYILKLTNDKGLKTTKKILIN